MLNLLWSSFFLTGIAVAGFKLIWLSDPAAFAAMLAALFDSAKLAFEIALGLTGVMALWLGILKIGEQAGAIAVLTRLLAPLFRRLFPEVPVNHPALGAMTMNLSANMLGLDNAATPMGLQAMRALQTLNLNKDTASDAQILFMVMNTAGVTLVPVTILTYRAQLGAAQPADVFVPILLATTVSSLAGLLAVALRQRVRLLDPVVLAYLATLLVLVGSLAYYLGNLPMAQVLSQTAAFSNVLLLGLVGTFILMGLRQRCNVYDAFIEGAREGFEVAVGIIPYLVAMLVAVGVFRASGALDMALAGLRQGVMWLGMDVRFVDALPTALMKPLSGSGSRAMMIDAMSQHGVDSLAGRMAAVIQGSTETTFYVLAVYFGAVKVRYMRHALGCSLLADLAGITAAIAISYFFFG